MKILKNWLKGAGIDKTKRLAEKAGCNPEYMRQVARGVRDATADFGARLERAAKSMGEPIRRGDVSKTCSRCPYYRAALKEETIA